MSAGVVSQLPLGESQFNWLGLTFIFGALGVGIAVLLTLVLAIRQVGRRDSGKREGTHEKRQ